MNTYLQMNHIRKSFDGNEVLRDISLTVAEGQVVSIIGPSGSGKSTLLRCATMLETMDAGDLIYLGQYAARDEGGRSIYAPPAELRRIRKDFGLVFQNFNLFPHYSVRKNITEPQLLAGRSREEAEAKADPERAAKQRPQIREQRADRNRACRRIWICKTKRFGTNLKAFLLFLSLYVEFYILILL